MSMPPTVRRRAALAHAVIGVAVLSLTLLTASSAGAAVVSASPFQTTDTLGRAPAVALAKAGRVRAIYARAQRMRARIPATRRLAYARHELAAAQARGSVHCLATAIYFEARKESLPGQEAVAEVVMARTRVAGRPKSICGVVYEGAWRTTGCQFSFTCDGRVDVARSRAGWARAKRVAALVLRHGSGKRFARGATFYHASYVKPRWSKRMVRVARIGAHIFYRPRRGRLL